MHMRHDTVKYTNQGAWYGEVRDDVVRNKGPKGSIFSTEASMRNSEDCDSFINWDPCKTMDARNQAACSKTGVSWLREAPASLRFEQCWALEGTWDFRFMKVS